MDSAPDVLDAACTSIVRSRTKGSISNTRLHQTRRQVSQCRRVCVARCPLTMRHVATLTRDSCGSESTWTGPHGSVTTPSYGGKARARGNDAEKLRPSCLDSLEVTWTTMHDLSLALALAQSGPRGRWRRDASKPDGRRRDTCNAPTRLAVADGPPQLSAGQQTHTQRAEEKSGW